MRICYRHLELDLGLKYLMRMRRTWHDFLGELKHQIRSSTYSLSGMMILGYFYRINQVLSEHIGNIFFKLYECVECDQNDANHFLDILAPPEGPPVAAHHDREGLFIRSDIRVP